MYSGVSIASPNSAPFCSHHVLASSVSQMPGGGIRRVLSEKDMASWGAPPEGWDTDIKKVKDIDWRYGERMSQEHWASLNPRVARDFYQQLGSYLYARCTPSDAGRSRPSVHATFTACTAWPSRRRLAVGFGAAVLQFSLLRTTWSLLEGY